MFLVLVLGCVTQQSFPDQYSREVCNKYEECVKAVFDATYDDVGECVDDLSSVFDDFSTDECDFDAGAASACLNEVRSTSCDELFSDAYDGGSCNDVYSGC